MPIVIVEAFEGRAVEQKRRLVQEITESVTKNFNVEPKDVIVIIHELAQYNFCNADGGG